MNTGSHPGPGLRQGFIAVLRRDVLLAWKRPGDVLNPMSEINARYTMDWALATGGRI